MYYVRVEGNSPEGEYSYMKPTNLELALDHLDDMVYSAESIGVTDIKVEWLDEANPDGWEDITTEYMGRK